MHTHENIFLTGDSPFDQGQMMVLENNVLIQMKFKFPQAGGKFCSHKMVDKFLMPPSVRDQILNGDKSQAVVAGHFFERGQSGHGAIGVHNLTDNGRRGESGETSEINAGLGVSGANQDSSVTRPQRKYMTRLREIFRSEEH